MTDIQKTIRILELLGYKNVKFIDFNIEFECNDSSLFSENHKELVRTILGSKLREFYYTGANSQVIYINTKDETQTISKLSKTVVIENMFIKGNKITTNRRNCLEVIDANEHQVVCKDLLNNDFSVFSKTEHNFEIADIKLILELSLKEIIDDTKISEIDKQHILQQMGYRLSSWM